MMASIGFMRCCGLFYQYLSDVTAPGELNSSMLLPEHEFSLIARYLALPSNPRYLKDRYVYGIVFFTHYVALISMYTDKSCFTNTSFAHRKSATSIYICDPKSLILTKGVKNVVYQDVKFKDSLLYLN